MSGKIKFKAWDFNNNRMWIVWQIDLLLNKIAVGNETQSFWLTDNFIPLQYTGLNDKNKMEIYEGDVLKMVGPMHIIPDSQLAKRDNIGDIRIVKRLRSGFTLMTPIHYMGSCKDSPNLIGNVGNYNFWNGASTSTEIIGNVYETSDFINGDA